MRIILGCECSGIIREAFRKYGHEAWSCDLKDSEDNGPHIKGNIFDYLGPCRANNYKWWDLFICHPPCTFNAISGAQWRWHPEDKNLPKLLRREHPLYPDRKQNQQRAIDFFKNLWNAPIDRICLENPKPLKSLVLQVCNYTQLIQPWQFGDSFSKGTCLWLKNLPRLKHTNIVDKGEFITTSGGKKLPKWYSDAKKGDKELTQTLRSRTFPGIADAMALQWGEIKID